MEGSIPPHIANADKFRSPASPRNNKPQVKNNPRKRGDTLRVRSPSEVAGTMKMTAFELDLTDDSNEADSNSKLTSSFKGVRNNKKHNTRKSTREAAEIHDFFKLRDMRDEEEGGELDLFSTVLKIQHQKNRYRKLLLLASTISGLGVPWTIAFPDIASTYVVLNFMVFVDLVFIARFFHVYYENQQLELAGQKFKINMVVGLTICFLGAVPFTFFSRSITLSKAGAIAFLFQSIARLTVYYDGNDAGSLIENAIVKTHRTIQSMINLIMICLIILHMIACSWIAICNVACERSDDEVRWGDGGGQASAGEGDDRSH